MNLLTVLMSASYQIKNFEDWFHQWIDYLLELIRIQDVRLCSYENLLIKSIQISNYVVARLLKDNGLDRIPIRTKLLIARTLRKHPVRINDFQVLLENMNEDVKILILCNCEETRHMALYALVESIKTVVYMNSWQSNLITLYMQYTLNVESSCTRQQNISLISEVLEKCGSNLQKKSHNNEKTITEYILFNDIIQIMIKNLFLGANFNRRIASTQILELCVRIERKYKLNLEVLSNDRLIRTLMRMLSDPYIQIKDVTLSMLKLIPECTHQFRKYLMIDNIKRLIKSTNIDEIVTGAYQLQLLYETASPNIFGSFCLPNIESNSYAVLCWLLNELQADFNMAKLSITKAARTNPLHGLLFSIQRLINNLDFSLISGNSLWKNIITKLISTCKKISNFVKPIVIDLSPEGYLPSVETLSNLPKSVSL